MNSGLSENRLKHVKDESISWKSKLRDDDLTVPDTLLRVGVVASQIGLCCKEMVARCY